MTTDRADARSSADAQPSEADAGFAELMAQTLAPIKDAADTDTPGAAGELRAKTAQDLQWSRLLALMAEHAVTPEGRAVVLDLAPLGGQQAVERRLAETTEAQHLLADDDPPPLVGLRDIRRAVTHGSRDGVLVGQDLAAIARNCDVASRCHRFFVNRSNAVPLLAAAGQHLNPCDELRREIHHAVEPNGELGDTASPDLRKLRRTVQNHHDRLRARVDQQLRRDDLSAHLQDDYYTVREDRYVLPVRVGDKTRVAGIVHGYSASGKTAFIEPTELVELNNELRWAEMALEAEENRIRERLSRLVGEYAGRLERNIDALAYVDIVVAGARFGQTFDGHIPTVSDQKVVLKQLRHPLLYLQHHSGQSNQPDDAADDDVIANDVVVDADRRVLVISGPNTGGKTVLLKAIGLCGLMVRCGLPIPAASDSCVPLFDAIFTDIGDEQSIERDLSTFSGHLTNINTFLDHCGPASLVLLDELFTGTDPVQGAALAVSLLEELAERGSTAAVTTHLENLKTLAVQNDAFANASMGFDVDDLEPTYRVALGIPGSSFAVPIARRLGFPQKLVDRALGILDGHEHHRVDEVLSSLEDQLGELEHERHRLEEERRQAGRKKDKYTQKYNQLRRQERESVHAETAQLKDELHQARQLIRDKIKQIQQAAKVERGDPVDQAHGAGRHDSQQPVTHQQLTDIQQQLGQAEQTIDDARETTRPAQADPDGLVAVADDDVQPGLDVFVRSFNRSGEVLERHSQTQVLVQIGALKANVELDDIFYGSEDQRRNHQHGPDAGAQSGGGRDDGPAERGGGEPGLAIAQTGDNTVDLRGLRVDEALEKVDMFLDHAFLKHRSGVHIIHGHGTGALKRAVRGHLVDSPYVDDFRPGAKGEGGDGVTVAALADDPGRR